MFMALEIIAIISLLAALIKLKAIVVNALFFRPIDIDNKN
jgi:hypothetical protein